MIMSYGTELKFIKEQMRRAFDAYGAIPFNTAQKSAFDLVTDVDKNIEKAVSAAIAERFPTDKILGEEFSFAQSITGRTWTIDPIDGTCNMAARSCTACSAR
jgi:fructose-1,6-bisphosphatase/inositol monophosphatase family enzyme